MKGAMKGRYPLPSDAADGRLVPGSYQFFSIFTSQESVPSCSSGINAPSWSLHWLLDLCCNVDESLLSGWLFAEV